MQTCAPNISRRLAVSYSVVSQLIRYRPKRFSAALTLCFLTGGLLLLTGGCEQPNRSKGVELVLSPGSPKPLTCFELRFEQAMLKNTELGVTTNSPLLFTPALCGTFTWVSPRSGIFTPTEPLALDTSYRLTLQPGLHCADGRRSSAGLRWTVKTPGLELIASAPDWEKTECIVEPEISLAFNAEVSAVDAGRYLTFRNATGHTIKAEVRQGTEEAKDGFRWQTSLRTWHQEFAHNSREMETTNERTNLLPNVLVVTPRKPLPVGKAWTLVIEPGLPAARLERAQAIVSLRSQAAAPENGHTPPPLRLRTRSEIVLGDVVPFEVKEIIAQNFLQCGPRIRLKFSRTLEAMADRVPDWIEVTPTPADLIAEMSGSEVTLLGRFRSETVYALKLNRKRLSDEPWNLLGSNVFRVTMPPVPPRIYFPAFSDDQLASGQRVFPFKVVNVPRLRVRAKLLDEATAIHTLRGYSSYSSRSAAQNEDEVYCQLDYNLVPGRTIYNEKFLATNQPDVAQPIDLDWSHILGDRRKGVIFLDARRESGNQEPNLGAQAVIQLTDLGLVWKRGYQTVDAFVFSYATGAPVAGARARLCSDENEILSEATTDTNGLARLTAHTRAQWITVQTDEDLHALPVHANRVWIPGINVRQSEDADATDSRRVIILCDRKLYRPSEQVHVKILARQWEESGLKIPNGLNGNLKCVDARGRLFFTTNAAFNLSGAWSFDLTLPDGPRGEYSLCLSLDGRDYRYRFEVEDFQPDAFEIALHARAEYRADERPEVQVSARYFFGKPLSRARVKWYLSAESMAFSAPGFESFYFGQTSAGHRGSESSSFSLNGEALLAGSSNLVIAAELPINSTAPQPLSASLLVEVTDLNQQTLSRRVDFTKHSSEFYIGLKPASTVLIAGEPWTFEAVAAGTDGRPWPEPVEAQLRLQRMDWQTQRIQGAGNTVRYHNQLILTNVLQQPVELQPVQPFSKAMEEVQGNRLPGFQNLPPGRYVAELNAKDRSGSPVICSSEFTVCAPAEMGWDYHNDTQLKLVPDQKLYAPGQTARIMIEAPFSGLALITVEREKVLRSFVSRLEGNAPVISVPILSNDVPNIFVSATLLRGADDSTLPTKEPCHRVGVCELAVVDPENRLSVAVAAAAPDYLPAETVEVTVQVDDAHAQPVAGAEVILYAIDEGVLSLRDYSVPDFLDFFYAPRSLGVQTSISLRSLLPEDSKDFKFQNKGFLGGGGSKGQCEPRQNFLACAYWNAALSTDSSGKASVRFPAPDGLTRYRLFAQVHHGERRFGNGQSQFKVSKPLVIEPTLPAFANISDRIVARAVVQNQTEQSGEAIVTLNLDEKALLTATNSLLTRKVFAAAKASVVVEFPVTFVESGTTKWTWTARFTERSQSKFADAVRSEIEVGYPLPVLHDVRLKRITTLETNLLAGANPQLLAGRGELVVTLSNTRLSELAETAAQLLHYPYGCAEQTSSSLLPWIVLGNATNLLPVFKRGTNNMDQAIRAGVARLFSMQTPSGGLGYWPGATEPLLWASAYGGFVLALAQRNGVTLPQEEFARLTRFLSKELRSAGGDPAAFSDCCLALYTLAVAGRGEPAYHEKLYLCREKLADADRALLALAVAESHGPPDMIDQLLRPGLAAAQDANSHLSSAIRTEALRLLAWTRHDPKKPIINKAVDELMSLQNNGHWGTTYADAWALLALTEYGRRVETKLSPAEGHFVWHDQQIPFRLDEESNVFTITLTLTNQIEPTLKLSNRSGTPLFSTVALSVRPPGIIHPRVDRGFTVQRRYDRLDDFNEPQQTQRWCVGDRVLVSLRVTVPRDSAYVVLDDALPSILEAINPGFKSRAGQPVTISGTSDRLWISDFHELRPDRYLSFANHLSAGDYSLSYVARVRAAGVVTAPPSKVEEMYHPERYGLSTTQTLNSEPVN